MNFTFSRFSRLGAYGGAYGMCVAMLNQGGPGVGGGLFGIPSPPQTPPLLINKKAHSYRPPSVWCGNDFNNVGPPIVE